MVYLFLAFAASLLFAVWEYLQHQRRVNSIPIRIHVNGTRGKSSVTRLIAAGLRAGGIRTLAKTTGTLPRIIHADGLEVPIQRRSGANIIEQVKVFRYFAKEKPQAIVIECMAVNPEYQWICEHRFVRASVGVITNTRLDHILEMGPTLENVTRSLCNTLPPRGVAYTAEQNMFWLMRKEAERSDCRLWRVNSESVSYLELGQFSYIEHADNVALALAVCEHYHVPREVALEGMYKAFPDPGALKVLEAEENGKVVQFINALAANDPMSTLAIWHKVKDLSTEVGTVIFMLNTRADRYDRTIQLLEMIRDNLTEEFDYLLLNGENLDRVYGSLHEYNIDPAKAIRIGMQDPSETYKAVFERVSDIGTVFAMGNVGKGGLNVATYFANRRRVRKGMNSTAPNEIQQPSH
ncbi:MAG: poly-gamma-glutamate synthase PgsB [Calditrichaeota bacterium]|nr:poly-gamma-glutamate synthase PgsB [Calditrichota bacterium]MCB9366456.1 poly-gamma-glutamate synthase PgsB [Calditrichota bacterium]MCB9391286.1 poly-gamma-glutamate synthase PgsB [Calditrichota bacterium]